MDVTDTISALPPVVDANSSAHRTEEIPLTSLVEVSPGYPFREMFHVLGFAVELQTNSQELLRAAHASWGGGYVASQEPALRLQFRVLPAAASDQCPPGPRVYVEGHTMSIVADRENFVICELHSGSAFGYLNQSAVCNPAYVRYHFLEAAAMCLLCTSRVTALHGACVGYAGRGLLFCGESGAGKSTLAYACARAGWAFTSDDASYLLWESDALTVRGSAHQVRFRPSAQELFPEIAGRELTPRAEGKPSIEVPTKDLPGLTAVRETQVHAVVLLRRGPFSVPELVPVEGRRLQPFFHPSLFASDRIRDLQRRALERLHELPLYELRYSDLSAAIARLETLALTTGL